MALTRANVEVLLIQRVGSLFTELGLDGTTANGSNPDLNDPIGTAIRKVGGSVSDLTAVADADLSGVATAKYDELIDRAELRALETALNAATRLVALAVGPRREQLGDIAMRLRLSVDDKRRQMRMEYGSGVSSLTAGVITLDLMQQNDDADGSLL
jgi:hypothetical protein